MVSNKSNKKVKKPVETTLGKASSNSKEKDTDLSHLRRPIETTICSIKQVISLLENATNEIKSFVMYECDIMYECRICRSIFRSLANFILHKRNYCREKINPFDYINNNETYQESVYMSEEKPHATDDKKKSLNKVIEKLQEMEYVKEVAKNVLTEDLSPKSSNKNIKDMDDRGKKSCSLNDIVLEKIDTNTSGVFQTLLGKSDSECSASILNKSKSTKLEVMEIHKIVENDVPVLDPDGKICGFTSNQLHQTSIFPKSDYSCTECNHRFASQKSLTHHIKCVHNPSRIIYVCPTCKDSFANPWCVYRHLLKVHRMTNRQVRRMREQVHNSWIRRGEESSIQKKKPPEVTQGETNSESQWINDIEGDNDFQMCAGCGKHFERKAALHSHSQMCAKRLEVCNNIKESAKKKEVEDAIERAKLEKTANEKPVLRGASKRKGQNICSYQRKPRDTIEMEKETVYNRASEHTLNLHNTEVEADKNIDVFNVIPNILTPKPSPSKSENNSIPSPIIIKSNQQKQQTKESLKITESFKSEENILQAKQDHKDSEIPTFISPKEIIPHDEKRNETSTEVMDTESSGTTKDVSENAEGAQKTFGVAVDNSNVLFVDTSIVKTEQNEDDDSNSDSCGVKNTIFIRNTKSEVISSEENSCSSLDFSVRSTKSESPLKLVKSPLEDLSRPRSDSFVSKKAGSSAKFRKSFSEDDSQVCSNLFVENKILASSTKLERATSAKSQKDNFKDQSKAVLRSKKIFYNMEDSSSEENSQSQLNSYFLNTNSEPIVSDNNECQDNNSYTLLQDNHDLLSNEVTFEMFCKKVASVGRTRESNKKNELNKRSPHMLRKRRRLTGSVEQSGTSNPTKSKNCDNDDDDVIFVGETLIQSSQFHDSSQALKNGFAGFPNEESSQGSYSVDLSNLSYNNPLKCKRKEDPNETELPQRNPIKRKNRGQSVGNRIVSKHEKNEFNFILRAAPYMNQAKLLCIPCGLTFRSFNLLLWHMSAHFSWFRFQCSKCSFITFNKYDCMLHARKQHKLKENNAANFILPLPNWKTVLMSHEFRLLKDCNDLKGKHTDEKIVIDENQDQYIEDSSEILESDAILFGESTKSSDESTGIVVEKENVKKRNKSGNTVIDIQGTIKDLQKLPEPVELAMPADVSEVIRTFSFNESTLSPDEAVTTCDTFGDESNDDWDLPKEREHGEISITKKDADKEEAKNEKTVNIRPSRIRTKAKQNDDFVYYDNDINSALKSTDFFKGSPPKHRTDSILTLKSKVSGKSVPITQKKKI